MSRQKGTPNKASASKPATLELSLEARIAFLANLIVDRIEQDNRDENPLLKKLKAQS